MLYGFYLKEKRIWLKVKPATSSLTLYIEKWDKMLWHYLCRIGFFKTQHGKIHISSCSGYMWYPHVCISGWQNQRSPFKKAASLASQNIFWFRNSIYLNLNRKWHLRPLNQWIHWRIFNGIFPIINGSHYLCSKRPGTDQEIDAFDGPQIYCIKPKSCKCLNSTFKEDAKGRLDCSKAIFDILRSSNVIFQWCKMLLVCLQPV